MIRKQILQTYSSCLKKADFVKDVEVEFPGEKGKDFTKITCDGPLEIEYQQGRATFNHNVIVENKDGKLFSNKAIVFFNQEDKKIERIISEGNVRIFREDNVVFARRATYLGSEEKLVLEGSPRLIYFPEEQ